MEITYAVDADGILQVSARELTTGIEQKIQVKPTYGLGEDEVDIEILSDAGPTEDDEALVRVTEYALERMTSSVAVPAG